MNARVEVQCAWDASEAYDGGNARGTCDAPGVRPDMYPDRLPAKCDVRGTRAAPVQGVPSPAKLVQWAEAALAGRSEDAQMTVRVVDEAEGAALNARYRRRAGATNVLAFAFDAPELPSLRILGDVVVCAPVAAREAREHGKPLDAHWAHLVIHGTLHLLGYDHEAPRSAQEMEAIEREILARLGYPDPYAAGARP